MIEQIVLHGGHVTILAQDDQDKADTLTRLSKTLKSPLEAQQHTRVLVVPHNDIWMRDVGPIFLVKGDTKKTLSFDWTYWGYKGHTNSSDSEIDGAICTSSSELLGLECTPINLASEGGDREYNGLGTLIVCEAVELQRNKSKSKQQIEDCLKEAFNVKKVIWMKEGVLEDQQSFVGKITDDVYTCCATGGHVDEFVRFVDQKKVLLAYIIPEEQDDPIASKSHQALEENMKILESETDQDGSPLQIIRMPMPPTTIIEINPSDGIYSAMQEYIFQDNSIIDGH
ncbi:aguA [Acrasis kona]|uniref:AguA n=1 Tax=Acrasis kona TaxID=1008807 RepID=A0AAW2Z4F2_9EUKA